MSIQQRVTEWLDSGRYGEFQNRWDDALFRDFISARLSSTSEMLDLGAGAGIVPEMDFRNKAKRICGVDPDPRVAENPFLDEGRVGTGEEIPYESESFDIVISDNVLEHLTQPELVFREVNRVLKPGGVFVAKTPNFWHYVALGATVTPHSFHRKFNAGRGRQEEDTFPTAYRANTKRDLKKLAQKTNFELRSCERIEGRPEYLRRWWPAYLAGAAYERVVNSTNLLAPFRVILMAELRKSV